MTNLQKKVIFFATSYFCGNLIKGHEYNELSLHTYRHAIKQKPTESQLKCKASNFGHQLFWNWETNEKKMAKEETTSLNGLLL